MRCHQPAILGYNLNMRDSKGRFTKGHRPSPETEFKKGDHWREPKAHWQKEWLEREYVTNLRSAGEIAEEQGCTENNILYWLKKHDIPRRSISEVRSVKHWGASGEENGMYGVRGEDHPGWKGGVTPGRQKLYGTNEWDRAARKCRKRAAYKCQRCGTPDIRGGKGNIHHIVPFGDAPELGADPDSLALLCVACHKWVHGPDNIEGRFLDAGTG